MNNYRITVEPISEQAMKNNPNTTVIEVDGYALGATETVQSDLFCKPGDRRIVQMHIHVQGTHLSDSIIHMIENLPEDILVQVAMKILKKKKMQQSNPLEDLVTGKITCSELDKMLRRFEDGL